MGLSNNYLAIKVDKYNNSLYNNIANHIYERRLYMSIGEQLAKIRKEKCCTQKELADLLNVSQQTISNIERDQRAPDIELLKGFADVYGISIDVLIGRRFEYNNENDITKRIIDAVDQLDDEGKKLSLELISQVVMYHQRIHK